MTIPLGEKITYALLLLLPIGMTFAVSQQLFPTLLMLTCAVVVGVAFSVHCARERYRAMIDAVDTECVVDDFMRQVHEELGESAE